MSESPPPAIASPNPFIRIFSVVVLGAVAAYFLFMLVNDIGLSSQTGTGVVIDKRFQAGGTSYFTQPIGGQRITRATENPDAYVVKLEINEQQTEVPLDKSLYDELSAGDRLSVTYQTSRITGTIRIIDAER